MASFDLVIFDLDGTLIDTIGDLGGAVNHAMTVHGFPTHTLEEYRMMVGHGVRNLVQKALGDASDETVDMCLATFLEYYCSHIAVHSKPYDGIHELLERLSASGVKIAVASNKFQTGTQTLIGKFFGDIDFCAVLGGRDGAPLKPDPAIVQTIVEGVMEDDARTRGSVAHDRALGSQHLRIAMVGDSATDIKTALAAGITPIGVTWGFRSESELLCSGATFIAHTVSELEKILLG